MKKIVSFLLSVVLLLSLVPVLPVTEAEAADYTNRALTTLKKEKSTIAPGITQEIGTVRKQYNGQQLVYYLMKVDHTDQYAEIHVNYKDNDWQAYKDGHYGLQTVKAQMDAAQERHNDIPNFTVVGGINGTGYNMSTGNSNDYTLMMEGHELNVAANANQGFFGVTESGKAIIGWSVAEYKAAKENKEDPLVEALGQFSGVLIKEGVIQQTDWAGSGSVPDCNARTAVGVTEDGDAFFLVVDGKQAPYSEGCDMYELAEILLKAGCYNAFNWDGGGSTTYVSRPEGEETYRVISKPCDGAPRNVATSLYVATTVPNPDQFDHVYIDSNEEYITPGGTVTFTVTGISAAGTPVDIPADVKWSYDENLGTFTEHGNTLTFVANEEQDTNDVTVTVTMEQPGKEKPVGTIDVHVVKPTDFSFVAPAYAAPYGETMKFAVKAIYKVSDSEEREVALHDGDVKITVEPADLGEVNGYTFTARQKREEDGTTVKGQLKATCLGLEATANLTVGRGSEVIVDFEDPEKYTVSGYVIPKFDSNTKLQVEIVDETNGKVHNGQHALKITVDWSYVTEFGLAGAGVMGQLNAYLGVEPDITDATGIGMWMWVPEEDVITEYTIYTDKENAKYVYKADGSYDEGQWVYIQYHFQEPGTTKLSNPFLTMMMYTIADTDPLIFNANSKVTYYFDDITADYSSVVPDRENPNFGVITESLTGRYDVLERGKVYDYGTRDTAVFQTEVTDNTGVTVTDAYIDGVSIGCTYANGVLATNEVALAPGVHTLKLYAADEAGNYTIAIRQFKIANDSKAATVNVVSSDKNKVKDNIPITSVYYFDVVTNDVSKIQSVSMDLDLDNISVWELNHADVNPKFNIKTEQKSFFEKDENIVTVTLTRNAPYEEGDSNIIASLPVRTWGSEFPFKYDKYNSAHPDVFDQADWTVQKAWETKWFLPVNVTLEVERGEIEYTDGYSTNAMSTFSGENHQILTELNDFPEKVVNANPGKTGWHVHKESVALPNLAPTCTTNGYKDRKECPECHSPVSESDWGEIVPALGHDYKLVDGVMKCSRDGCGVLFTGVKDGKTYVDGVCLEGWQEDNTYYVDGVKLGEGLHKVTEEDGSERWHNFDENGVCKDKDIAYTGYYTGTDGHYTAVEMLPAPATLKNTAYYYVEGGLPYEGWLFFNQDGDKQDNTETPDPGTGEDGGDADVDPDANPEDPNGGNKDEGQQKLGEIIGYHVHSDGRVYGSTQVDTRKCVESGYIRYTCDDCKKTKDSQWLWWVGHDWDENHVCKREGCGFHGLNIADASLNIMGKRFNYTGSPIRAAVYVYHDSKSLSVRSDKNGLDGYVWYENNTAIGEATVHIRGEGNYYGEISGTFEIVPQSVKEVRKTESNGSADKVTVTLKWDECLGADYYDVYRYDYDAGQWIIKRVDAPATTFSEELALGTKYDYRVASRAQRGEKIYYSALWPEAVYGTIEHVWGEEENIVEPKCDTEGSYTHTCTECGFVETVTVPATGHTVEEWIVTEPATTTAPGSRTGECTVCGETVTEVIPQLSPVITGTGNTTSPDAKQETVTNPDGSTTTTTTNSDGSVTETTTQTDGTVTEKNTDADGVVTETTTKPDNTVTEKVTQTDGSATERTTTPEGVTGQVNTDAEGEVTSAEVVIPKEAEKQDVVTAPVEVPASKTTEDAPEISVRSESAESTKVEIPVTEFGPGTVAVVVNPDGTEEIVRDCVIGENGVVLNVEGDVTLKIVDNTETFEDVEPVDHWASDAVEFVAARELFKGTGANKFTPNGAMTRGMMVTVLYRLAYEPETVAEQFADVPSGQYYTDAVAWAQNAGVVTGYTDSEFGPNDNVKREQLVTILYRYAKKMGYATTSSGTLAGYADASSVSGWAKDAMSWAVELGLVNGVDKTHLAPFNDATRAEVAAILMRFCEKVVK